MKILSCHIENFGKIHDYSMRFSDGVNLICEENGWGKSTFAAFIRAMFYGLEGERKRSIAENERKRYKPWQGGIFGGQLVFEIRGKTYLISRVFKDKEANDEFELREAETNLLSKEYTDRIGEEIFHINRESFMRTVFIEQNGCETSSTDDINAKIGRLADHSNDLNNFESAGAKLTEILNKLNPNRATGSIAKRSEEIARYERIVKGGEGLADSIERYQQYLRAEEESHELLKEKMNKAVKIQKKVSEKQSVMAKKSEWERLKNTAERKKEEKEKIEEAFPGKVPDPEEVKKKAVECGDMEKTSERVSMYRLAEAEEEELSSLTDTFTHGVPAEAEIEGAIRETKKFGELSRAYRYGQMSADEKKRLEELEPYFADEAESVSSVISKWNDRYTRKMALPSKKAALAALKASAEAGKPQKSSGAFIMLILGLIFAVAGLFMAVSVSLIGGALIAVTGVGLVVVGILLRKGGKSRQSEPFSEFEEMRKNMEEDEKFIAETDKVVADYLSAHDREFEEHIVSAVLQEIAGEAMEYASLKRKMQRASDPAAEVKLEALLRSVMAFLDKYGMVPACPEPVSGKEGGVEFTRFDVSELMDNLYMLKNKAEQYKVLEKKRENFKMAEREYREFETKIYAFLEEYRYKPSDNISAQLSDIRDQTDHYQNAVKSLEEAQKDLDQFESANDVLALERFKENTSLPTPEELNRIIQNLAEEREKAHNKIVGYNSTLEDLQEEYDEWEENHAKLCELKSVQNMEQKKYQYVFMAKKKLELAKEAMTAKYAGPIFRRFSEYYEMISGEEAANYHIDANTAVTVDEWGKQRDTDTLSSGYRDMVGLCLRTALVDAMYQEEEPPLIMDDPFTNLDDKKVAAGRKFMEILAEKYQIIYFTCSSARK